MVDKFVETTRVGFGSKIKSALSGVVLGLVLFVGAFPLLFWNENRAVLELNSLNEAEGVVVTVDSSHVDAVNEGKLVHTSGVATTQETLADPSFAISANAIKLKRDVQMYQWEEKTKSKKEKKVGGSEEVTTEYTYSKVWTTQSIDSSRFRIPQDHLNPTMALASETWQARDVSLGDYQLNKGLVDKIQEYEQLRLSAEDLKSLPIDPTEMRVIDGQFYWGKSSSQPQVGDMRIQYQIVKPLNVSVIGKQIAKTFESYTTNAGGEVLLLSVGTLSANNMFVAAKETSAMMTWIWRLVGLACMFIGLSQFLKPISVMGDVLPFVGNILEMGIGLVAFLIALPLTLITIAIAWFAVRPLLSIVMIVLAIGSVVGIKVMSAKVSARKAA